MTLAPAARLGRYEIVSLLGVGGMGEVYRARDAALSRDVAIKVLPRSVASDADRIRRFDQEARAAGRLSHPNVLAVYDIGVHEGSPYVVSELLQGQTLRERLHAGPVPVRKAIEYSVQVAHGLSAAHHVGIVHRDLKPENLFLTRDGLIKILDFGLAKLKPPLGDEADQTLNPTAAPPETEPGVILGTVGYMSPEQVRGYPADHRSDIFSLGAILYEMISGHRAFRGESTVQTLGAILEDDPPELSAPRGEVLHGLEKLIRCCLEKSPDDRLQSAQDLAFALGLLAEHSGNDTAVHSVAATRRWWLPALAVLVVIGAAVSVMTILGPWRTTAPTFQRLTFRRGSVWSARFAPDGHTIVYGAAWEGNPVRVFATEPEGPESARWIFLQAT